MSDSADSGNRGNGLAVAALAQRIHLIRGHKVMLDADLAELYGAPTKALNQAVKRNAERFPPDFMFRLSADESLALRSQTVTSNAGRGGRRTAPYAFTEQGVAMLSSVLGSTRAIGVNIEIMRTFVRVRELAVTHHDLAKRLGGAARGRAYGRLEAGSSWCYTLQN